MGVDLAAEKQRCLRRNLRHQLLDWLPDDAVDVDHKPDEPRLEQQAGKQPEDKNITKTQMLRGFEDKPPNQQCLATAGKQPEVKNAAKTHTGKTITLGVVEHDTFASCHAKIKSIVGKPL